MSFRRSSFCSTDHMTGNCVEVDAAAGEVFVRHSEHPEGPVLVFSDAEWVAFILGCRAGEFDIAEEPS